MRTRCASARRERVPGDAAAGSSACRSSDRVPGSRLVSRALNVDRARDPGRSLDCATSSPRRTRTSVLVTPLVDIGSDQVEYIKAVARARHSQRAVRAQLGQPDEQGPDSHRCPIASSSGTRRRSARRSRCTACSRSRSVATGAPVYDQWFARRPSTTREEFCRKVGLLAGQAVLPVSLLVAVHRAGRGGVHRQVGARRPLRRPIRASAQAGILIRPHPGEPAAVAAVRLRRSSRTSCCGRAAAPTRSITASKNDYFDSMYHSVAAVGINTSAQIESGIVGRPVFSVRVREVRRHAGRHAALPLPAERERRPAAHGRRRSTSTCATLTAALDRTEEDDRRLRSFVEGVRAAERPRRAGDADPGRRRSRSSRGCRSRRPSVSRCGCYSLSRWRSIRSAS